MCCKVLCELKLLYYMVEKAIKKRYTIVNMGKWVLSKELFKYIRSFNEEVPDLSNYNILQDLTTINTESYKNVFKNFQEYKIRDIFQQGKNIVNKYLHTEYMLYYNLTKNGNPISYPVHFVSYLRMCSSCEKLWATKTPCEKNTHNTVCFFKEGEQNTNKENINTSFLQIYKENM